MRSWLFAVVAAAFLSGCGTAYRSAAEEFIRTQPASAWGAQPPPGHVEVEKAYIQRRLKDPGSANFEVVGLQRVTVAASLTNPEVVPVWMSSLRVNAKNSYGGYTGFKVWNFYYRSGELYALESEEGGRQYVKKMN